MELQRAVAHRVVTVAAPRIEVVRWDEVVDLVVAGRPRPQVIETGHNRHDEDKDRQQRFGIPAYPTDGKIQPASAFIGGSLGHKDELYQKGDQSVQPI